MLKLEQGADVSLRLLELGLQALNFDLSLSVESAESVVAAARSNYRQLARALHPDKCKLSGAADAFSGLSMAMRIVSEYSLEKEEEEREERDDADGINIFVQPTDGAAAGVGASSAPSSSSTSLEPRVVWNQSRLVVDANCNFYPT